VSNGTSVPEVIAISNSTENMNFIPAHRGFIIDTNNIMHIAYAVSTEGGESSYDSIVYARSTNGGQTWNKQSLSSTTTNTLDYEPRIIMNSTGSMIIVYSERTAGNVYYRISNDKGLTWTTEQRAFSSSTISFVNPIGDNGSIGNSYSNVNNTIRFAAVIDSANVKYGEFIMEAAMPTILSSLVKNANNDIANSIVKPINNNSFINFTFFNSTCESWCYFFSIFIKE